MNRKAPDHPVPRCPALPSPAASAKPRHRRMSRPAAETQPVATTPAEMAPAAEPAPEAETALDTKAFAGNFSGTLPCADCPGIDTTLELHADGSFMLMETYQERKVEPGMLEGTWTAEENGSRIRLDPNSKSEQDRLYAVDLARPDHAAGQRWHAGRHWAGFQPQARRRRSPDRGGRRPAASPAGRRGGWHAL